MRMQTPSKIGFDWWCFNQVSYLQASVPKCRPLASAIAEQSSGVNGRGKPLEPTGNYSIDLAGQRSSLGKCRKIRELSLPLGPNKHFPRGRYRPRLPHRCRFARSEYSYRYSRSGPLVPCSSSRRFRPQELGRRSIRRSATSSGPRSARRNASSAAPRYRSARSTVPLHCSQPRWIPPRSPLATVQTLR